jgi:predicted DsbA family dithiol-disulfide isomerase
MADYLRGRYGDASVAAIYERLKAVAEAEGLPMADLGGPRVRANTFAAHRLQTAALAEAGEAVQQALADALFHACWAEARDVGDHDVLAEAAAAAGLGEARAREILAAEDYTGEVRAEERAARDLGITAVPTFIVDGRYAVTGAQSPETLAQAVRRAREPAAG